MSALATGAVVAPHAARAGEAVHVFRPSLFSGEREFVVDADALRWSDNTGEHSVPLSAIRQVQVYHAPASGDRTIRRTIIRLQDRRKLVVQSNHFVRLATFEDRVESYGAFLHTLVRGLQAANPSATVWIGPPIGLWLTYVVLLVAAAGVLLAGVVLWIIGEFPLGAAVTFALLTSFLPLCWRVARGGRARRVDVAEALAALPD